MKAYRVILEECAMIELEESFRWIAKDNPGAAIRWYNGCIDALESLRTFPQRSPKAPEAAAFGQDLRQLIYGNYRAIFTVKGDAVHVLHVVHGARDYLKPDDAA